MKLKSYRDLKVWQKAMDLVVDSYKATRGFPKSELFGLASQMQRAGVSVPANVAEGRARQHTKEFIRHLSIAYGLLAELETHIQIAERLNYLESDQVDQLMKQTSEVGRMINGLKRSLEKKLRHCLIDLDEARPPEPNSRVVD